MFHPDQKFNWFLIKIKILTNFFIKTYILIDFSLFFGLNLQFILAPFIAYLKVQKYFYAEIIVFLKYKY